MKRFLLHILLFCLVVALVDRAVGVLVNAVGRHSQDQRIAEVLAGKTKMDILVMGSSRGTWDIDSKELSKATGRQVANLGFPGSDIAFHRFLLETMIRKGSTPRTIVLVLDDPSELQASKTLQFRDDALYPFMDDAAVTDTLIAHGKRNPGARFLNLLCVDFATLSTTWKDRHKTRTTLTAQTLLDTIGKKPVPPYQKRVLPYDRRKEQPEKVRDFVGFQALCRKNQIQLYLVFPPNFALPTPGFQGRIRELAGDTPMISYDPRLPEYTNARFFHDESHLNAKGAAVFARDVGRFLKRNGQK
ncbi:MAG TPA: hypothetical protein VK183_11775 [Flavobacterium sp.]|nr:hypothetical protein [Flavobacterium sp.]